MTHNQITSQIIYRRYVFLLDFSMKRYHILFAIHKYKTALRFLLVSEGVMENLRMFASGCI